MILPAVLLKRNYLIWTLDLRRNCAVATQSPNPVSSMCCACCFDATSYIPTQAWKRKDRQMFVCFSVDPKSNVQSQRPKKIRNIMTKNQFSPQITGTNSPIKGAAVSNAQTAGLSLHLATVITKALEPRQHNFIRSAYVTFL